MNDLITCGVVHLGTKDLVNLYREFKARQQQAAADYIPGKPILFGALSDIMAAEIGRRYNDENEKRAILEAAG